MKMKCTSLNVEKIRMPVKFKSGFTKTTMLARIKHSEFTRNSFIHTFSTSKVVKMKATSGQSYKRIKLSCVSLNSDAYTKADEYLIKNKIILNNIIDFRNIANSFVKLFNMSGSRKLISKVDNPYLILQYHQENIKSFDQFRQMKVSDVITEELFFALTCL